LKARSLSLALASLALLTFATWGASPLRAESDTASLLKRAQKLADDHQWTLACAAYDELFKKEGKLEYKAAYKECLCHVLRQRRLQDESFRTKLIGLKRPADALDVYQQVLVVLRENYLDRDKVDVAALFQQSLRAFQFTLLEDEVFKAEYLAGVSQYDLDQFKHRFDGWLADSVTVRTEADARDKVQEVALAATALKLKPTVVIFEFTWGACNALDEYTNCLTPAEWAELTGTLKGNHAGIGVKLSYNENKQLIIARVFADSPAKGELKVLDRITHIDGQDVSKVEFTKAQRLLLGEAGSTVELRIDGGDMTEPRVIKVQRGRVPIPSVEDPILLGPEMTEPSTIGYVKVNSFSETTARDLKSAIVRLKSSGMQVLILDLRGNPGGSFPAGVKVAELFLADGVIVYKQGRDKDESHKAQNSDPFDMPLVVLVDGDTASAAEVVAGALKENNRARLVGQTTFGKGSIQKLIEFDKAPGGMRVTVAHFLSPTNQPYTGQGVVPHRIVDLNHVAGDTQLQAAQEEARSLGKAMGMMGMKMMQ
jgi:carboxyl-terminal processing protease